MYILLAVLLLFIPTFDARRSHKDDVKNYIYCAEDSPHKHPNFSYPGKEVICENINDINENYVLEKKACSKKDKKLVIQFISVQGSLHYSLTEHYSSVLTILVYRSHITDFSLPFVSRSQLIIIESDFPTVTRSIFYEASDLSHLGFYSNPGLVLEERCFSDLTHLRNLTIYNQTLPYLKSNNLAGLKNLRRLVVMKTGLTNIDPDAFANTPKLSEIIFDYNPLERFNANITNLDYLRKLSLMNTNLKKFNLPLFFPVKRLAVLSLSNEAWSKMSVIELAQAFPVLRTAIFNKNEPENERLKQLIEAMESAGLVVEKIGKPIEMHGSVYEDDMKVIAW